MTEDEFEAQWTLKDIPACPEGMKLLRTFADAHPTVWQFVRPHDFIDLHNDAFAGMAEWEAFAAHCENCDDCNEA